MYAKLIALSQPMLPELVAKKYTAEDLLIYIARVSNPQNQLNQATAPKLLRHCLTEGHWSVFEGATMTVEVQTSRAIAAQMLRHKFKFQEFSQRYSAVTKQGAFPVEPIELRAKAVGGNRQGSGEVVENNTLNRLVAQTVKDAFDTYDVLLESGVSPETARMVLPVATTTTMYVTGDVRNWIHYLQARTKSGAQKEHRLLAEEIKKIFVEQFPETSRALLWKE